MATFDPPELEQAVTDAVRRFQKILGVEADGLFDHIVSPSDWEAEGHGDPEGNWHSRYESSVITSETNLAIDLPYCDSPVGRTCAEFLDLVKELENASIDENLFCRTNKCLLLRVAPVEGQEETLFNDILGLDRDDDYIIDAEYFSIEVPVDTQSVRCSIRHGLTPFGVLIAAGHDCDKYFPPLLPDELFVEVRFKDGLNEELARTLVYAYLFEVSASLHVELVPDPRPIRFAEVQEQRDIPAADGLRLRPLMIGKGIEAVLHLYHGATKTLDPEIQVLQFYRVFEHVSATVTHKNLVEDARMKLMSTSALDPDAEFVLELKSLFELHKGFSKEREAIKLTFRTCCEPTELLKVAPDSLRKTLTLLPAAKTKERHEALDKVGVCLVATRNSVAHSKANYEPTGEECPLEELGQFVACIKVAAQQAIRWYHSQPEKLRIL